MGKRFSKSEKLDLILSELEKLRVEVKKLARDRAPVADQGMKAKPRSAAILRSCRNGVVPGTSRTETFHQSRYRFRPRRYPNRLAALYLKFLSRLRPKLVPPRFNTSSVRRESQCDPKHDDHVRHRATCRQSGLCRARSAQRIAGRRGRLGV